MRFGVLGPLAVWRADGTPVRIPELKVRALLADLLASGGQPLAAHRIIDDLWGEALPVKPSGALHAKVSQLRRVLESAEPGGRALVQSRPPGYALAAGADAVDAERFTSLLARARSTGEPALRAELLDEALAQWRGPAFADFAEEPFARAAISRLEENRLVALEERAETRLALGEHAQLSGELADLVAQYPLRERLRAVQLRALYGAGRRTEALAGYRELRALLAEELGLDPGRELDELHESMLRQDPSLDPPRAPAAPATTAPAVLSAEPAAPDGGDGAPPPDTGPEPVARPRIPTPLTELVGRAEAVREVGELLAAHRLVTLTGPGGVGKTRLALEAARRLDAGASGRFPDGAVHVVELSGPARDGSGPETVAGAVAGAVATALGLGSEGDAASHLLSALAPRTALLVLDNCEHLTDAVAELAAQLLSAAPGLRVLATSQEPLALAGEVVLPVPPLAPGDAVALFAARAAAASPGFAVDAGNAEAVAALCRRLDGIPLVLELAATRVRALGVPGLLARLDDRFRLLDAGQRGVPPRQRTLRAALDWSWGLLDGTGRAVLRRLAGQADGCSLHAAEEVCAGGEVARADVPAVLAELVGRSLVTVTDNPDGPDGPDGPHYRLLESVAAYGLERLREAGELDRTTRRTHARLMSVQSNIPARPALEDEAAQAEMGSLGAKPPGRQPRRAAAVIER